MYEIFITVTKIGMVVICIIIMVAVVVTVVISKYKCLRKYEIGKVKYDSDLFLRVTLLIIQLLLNHGVG